MALKNIIGQKTTTTGAIGVTATIDLDGAALSAHNTFADGGAVSGTAYSVAIKEGSARQVGVATYTSGSPGTLTIDSILASTNGGSAITLSGDAEVYVDALAEDLGGGGGLKSHQFFTSSGTWTKPAGITLIKIICQAGGGGGGGGTGGTYGSGGGLRHCRGLGRTGGTGNRVGYGGGLRHCRGLGRSGYCRKRIGQRHDTWRHERHWYTLCSRNRVRRGGDHRHCGCHHVRIFV